MADETKKRLEQILRDFSGLDTAKELFSELNYDIGRDTLSRVDWGRTAAIARQLANYARRLDGGPPPHGTQGSARSDCHTLGHRFRLDQAAGRFWPHGPVGPCISPHGQRELTHWHYIVRHDSQD